MNINYAMLEAAAHKLASFEGLSTWEISGEGILPWIKRARLALEAAMAAAPKDDPTTTIKMRVVGWIYEDDLPTNYPYDAMFDHSKVDGVRMFPVFAPDNGCAPPAAPQSASIREALEWYGEQSRLARLIHSEGDAGRWALAEDGGKRARAALAATDGQNDEV